MTPSDGDQVFSIVARLSSGTKPRSIWLARGDEVPERRVHAEHRLPPWVTGDQVYGRDPQLRAWLESPEVNTGYVLGISTSTRITWRRAPRSAPTACSSH
jgi:hypothetical protein